MPLRGVKVIISLESLQAINEFFVGIFFGLQFAEISMIINDDGLDLCS